VGPAADTAAGSFLEVPAGDVHPRGSPQLFVVDPQAAELESFDMAHEPGAVVVLLPFEHRDPEGHVEGAALTAEATTGGWCHPIPEWT
jgi:hypothetical protein